MSHPPHEIHVGQAVRVIRHVMVVITVTAALVVLGWLVYSWLGPSGVSIQAPGPLPLPSPVPLPPVF